MPEIILHHYPLSPYSEKIRLALGLKGISWKSVEIPVWTPRPKLTPMTGGYRRTPILQVDAEFIWLALSQRPGSACKGAGLVDREGFLHERRVPDDRQHARAPPRAHR